MVPFLLALQFLTVIPLRLKKISDKDLSRSLVYFPLVGLFLGLLLAGLGILLDAAGINRFSLVVILTVSLAALTGGMHLDGLADTLDALSSHKDREGMLAVMRDPRTGPAGVLGIVSILLLKIALLFSLRPSLLPISFMFICLLSRWALVYAIFLFPYARPEGKAKAFFYGINGGIFSAATVVAAAFAIILAKTAGLIIIVAAAAAAYLGARFLCKKFSGLSGDTLGALNEFTELVVLCAILITERSGLWMTN